MTPGDAPPRRRPPALALAVLLAVAIPIALATSPAFARPVPDAAPPASHGEPSPETEAVLAEIARQRGMLREVYALMKDDLLRYVRCVLATGPVACMQEAP